MTTVLPTAGRRRPFVTGALGFTCAACHLESAQSPIRFAGIGLVCRLCASFLVAQATISEEAR